MNQIEYVEIRTLQNDDTLEFVGIVDEFQSIIWHTCYNSSGDFEIYAPLNENNEAMLRIGHFVCRSDRKDIVTGDVIPTNDIGVIESVNKSFDVQAGYMITAVGRMADSLLDRRLIIKVGTDGKPYPTTLSGNVQQGLTSIMGTQLSGDRDIPLIRHFESLSKSEVTFGNERQVTYSNLLEYVQSTLQEFNLGLSAQLYQNYIRLYHYVGRKTELVFSTEYDNLISCNHTVDKSTLKTTALVGGEGEGTDRAIEWVNADLTKYDRRELFVDDSSITRKYQDAEGNEQTYDEETYRAMLRERGSLELSSNSITVNVEGQLNVTSSGVKFREDFYLGDLVTIEDVTIGVSAEVRVMEVTEVQDANGYTIEMTFGG